MGIERVNDVFNVDLDIVRGLCRFDSGISLGAVVMFGYVDYLDVPDEGRYEVIVGYSPGILKSKFSPYAFITKGVLSYFVSLSRNSKLLAKSLGYLFFRKYAPQNPLT